MPDKIGTFRGKAISKMDRLELLEFATWATTRIQFLEEIADRHQELDLLKETLK